MKNLRVSVKLIASFLIVALFTTIVGVVGIFGMRQIDASFDEMYNLQTVPLPELGKAIEMLQRQRACMRDMIIGAATGDQDLVKDSMARADEYREIMYPALDSYYSTMRDPEAIRLFDEARSMYDTQFRECITRVFEYASSGRDALEVYDIMRQYTDAVNKIVDNFDKCLAMKITTAAGAAHSSSALADRLLLIIIAVLIGAVTVAVFFALYISGLISKPLLILSNFMQKAGTTGDITLSADDKNVIGKYAELKDEIGQTIKSSAAFVEHVTYISKELETVAGGDLTSEVKLLSNSDTMGVSLKSMVGNLNNMFGEIKSSTAQVSTGSKQIADGAQSLAQGSTEQAASVEELSSSITEIAGKTKDNAQLAEKAATLAHTIMDSAEKGSQQMDEMMTAVKDINEASQAIGKIIKTIDDIAFQTNILALNAAVEAARAGQHGKGFAVVAEEVRNLAAKSAEAAKETGAMIANSMEKAELGSRIAGETASSLTEIVSGINESNMLVTEIAKLSEEQSSGISQVNIGIDQVAQVVQQNSATAEESAAASEEMSGQSAMLEQLISQFKLSQQRGMSFQSASPPKPAAKQYTPPPQADYDYDAGNSFGASDKY